jgi:putrescine transport system permease protein
MSYLPFMVLPLYMPIWSKWFRLIEETTWAHHIRHFWLVTVPLSKAGIVAGFMLVFIPSVGLSLGGPENPHDWPGCLG